MKRVIITLFFILTLLNCVYGFEFPIPSEVKKAVAFIYTFEESKNLTKGATGFFIGQQSSKNPDQYFVSLVTAKHVIQTDDSKSYLPYISVRLNTVDGGSNTFKVPIYTEGANKNVFMNEDPTVDLAVIPLLPNKDKYDFKFLGADLLTTKEDFPKLNISEGSDVFFSGLFIPYMGKNRIYPVVRFGKVALIPDEKVAVNGEKKDVYLIEAGAYGGSSGAPVFVNVDNSKPGTPEKLIGIISNHFIDRLPVQPSQTETSSAVVANIGIAIIEPAYKLQEILASKELENSRSTPVTDSTGALKDYRNKKLTNVSQRIG